MYNRNYYPINYPRRNTLSNSFRNIKWSSILDGTQKSLSIINQIIPIIYQIKPIYQNAKTAFKVVNAFKEETKEKKESIKPVVSNNKPTYFL